MLKLLLNFWNAGRLDIFFDGPRQQVLISQAARHLNVSIDLLRNWERNGLLQVPRDPLNQYRLYGTLEFGRIRVVRTLVQAGYSLMSILQMLRKFDTGSTDSLRAALNLPPEADEKIEAIADRWLVSLLEMEQRALAIIGQLGRMIEMAYSH